MGLMSASIDTERRSPLEVNHRFHYDTGDDRVILELQQDVAPILASNREKQTIDDGYTKDRSMKRVARIPLVIVEKIMRDKGWNPLDSNNSDRLLQLLDDPEYAYLKTSVGKHARRALREFFRGSCSTKMVYAGDE